MTPEKDSMGHLNNLSAESAATVVSNVFSLSGLKIGLSIVSIAGEWAFGGNKEALIVVFLLIIMDTMTGIFKAAKRSDLSSRGFFRFSTKVLVYFVMMATSAMVDKSLPVSLAIPVMYTFLAVTEGISILENIGEAGFPVPVSLIRTLEVLKDKKKDSD